MNFLLRELKGQELKKIYKNFEEFILNIEMCEQSPHLIIKYDHFCIRRENCFAKSRISTQMRSMFELKKEECSCPKDRRFECSKNLCAINEHNCMRLLQKKPDYLKEINHCKILRNVH